MSSFHLKQNFSNHQTISSLQSLFETVSLKLTFQAGNSTKCLKHSNVSAPHFLFTCNSVGDTTPALKNLLPKEDIPLKDVVQLSVERVRQ